MLLNRIRDAIDPHLRDNQNGFRKERTTVAQILALMRIIEEVKKNNLTAVPCFIDFKKAFDSINRGVKMKNLMAYGVPPTQLRAIETRCSEEFDILAGMLQGDNFARSLHRSSGLSTRESHHWAGAWLHNT